MHHLIVMHTFLLQGKNSGEVRFMTSKNGTEIPTGLGMALIQNTEAFFRFSKLDAATQQRVIDGAKGIESESQMQAYVSGLG